MKNYVIMIPLLRVTQRVGPIITSLLCIITSLLHSVLLLPIITFFSLPNLQMPKRTKQLSSIIFILECVRLHDKIIFVKLNKTANISIASWNSKSVHFSPVTGIAVVVAMCCGRHCPFCTGFESRAPCTRAGESSAHALSSCCHAAAPSVRRGSESAPTAAGLPAGGPGHTGSGTPHCHTSPPAQDSGTPLEVRKPAFQHGIPGCCGNWRKPRKGTFVTSFEPELRTRCDISHWTDRYHSIGSLVACRWPLVLP